MAFVLDQNQEDNTEQGGVGVGTGGGGLIGSGAGTVNASTPTNAKTGTGLSNLQAYLDANKDQAGQMAQNVVGQLEQDQSNFQDQVNEAQTSFQDLVAQNNPTAINPMWVNTPGQTPTDPSFFSILNNQFQGPTDFTQTQDYQGLQSALEDYQDRANLLGSESGRSSLLTEMAGPGATRGGNALDQFLLQNDAGAREALGVFQEQAQGAGSVIDDAVAGTNQYVADTQSALSDASEELAALLAQMYEGEGKTTGMPTGYGMIDPIGAL